MRHTRTELDEGRYAPRDFYIPTTGALGTLLLKNGKDSGIIVATSKQKIGYKWNTATYQNRTYTDPDGVEFSLLDFDNQTYTYSYKYRDEEGNRKKGSIDIEVRFDPHCFTREREAGETQPALSFDEYDDHSKTERVFDRVRYENRTTLINAIKHLSNKDCKESRVTGKALYFKQENPKNPRFGLYVIIKVKRKGDRLVMYVETAHNRNNEPYKLGLSDKTETYSIILGRLISEVWPDLLPST